MVRLTLLASLLAFGCHPAPSTGAAPGPEPTAEPTPTPTPTPDPTPAANTGNGSTGTFQTGSATTTTTTTTGGTSSTVAECPKKKCGPALGMKSTACSDGSVGGPTGRCLENADKTCKWEIRSCP